MRSSSTSNSKLAFLAAFGIPAILFLAGIEVICRELLIPFDFQAFRIHAIYTSRNPNAVFGDSHIRAAFSDIYPFQNGARGGEGARVMEVIVKNFFKFKRPEKVMILASPHIFGVARIKSGVQDYESFFGQHVNLPFAIYALEKGITRRVPNIVELFIKKLDDERWMKGKRSEYMRWLRLCLKDENTRRIEEIIGTVVKPRDQVTNNYWAALSKEKRTELARKRFQRQRPVENYRETEDFQAYRRTIEFLKDRGAHVCMIRTPVSDEYLELIENDVLVNQVLADFRAIAKEFGVKYLDFRELAIEFAPDMFRNQDHLSPYGRRQYSLRAIKLAFGKPSMAK